MIFCSHFLYKWMFEPMEVTFFFFNSVVCLYREYQVTQRVYTLAVVRSIFNINILGTLKLTTKFKGNIWTLNCLLMWKRMSIKVFVLLKGSHILFLIYEMDFDVSLSHRDFPPPPPHTHLLYQLSAISFREYCARSLWWWWWGGGVDE